MRRSLGKHEKEGIWNSSTAFSEFYAALSGTALRAVVQFRMSTARTINSDPQTANSSAPLIGENLGPGKSGDTIPKISAGRQMAKTDIAYFQAVQGSMTSEDGKTFKPHVKRPTANDLLLCFR